MENLKQLRKGSREICMVSAEVGRFDVFSIEALQSRLPIDFVFCFVSS
jgi:hypothetical protein